MKENPGDIIMNKLLERREKVSDIMARRLKGSKPFGVEPLSSTAKIWAADNLGYEDMNDLIKEFGEEPVSYMLYEINKLKTDNRRVKWQMEM